MSIAAVNHVRTLRGLTPTERAMLFTLAGYTGVQSGLAWPSIAALAADNELSKRRTWEILHELEKKNRISREHKGPAGRQVTFYQIVGVVPQEVAQKPAQEVSPPAESRSANKEERVFKGYRKGEQEQPRSLALEKIPPQPSALGFVDWQRIANGNGYQRPRMTAQVERQLNNLASFARLMGPEAAMQRAKETLPESWRVYLNLGGKL